MKKTAIVTALLCSLAASCSAPATRPPEIRVVDLQGLETALAEQRGKGVLLNFWAIWCEPCVAELPELLEIAREYRDQGGVVLGVSYDLMVPDVTRDGVMEQMRAFVAGRKMDIPVLIYSADDYDSINERFGLPGPIPYTVALDGQGKIVDRHEGQSGKQGFRAMMEKALGKPQS